MPRLSMSTGAFKSAGPSAGDTILADAHMVLWAAMEQPQQKWELALL